MSDLKLDSLRIQNFRTFKDLTIDRLGRVNLIVGKNNVGKTSLLEALNLYVRGGTGDSLDRIVEARQLNKLDEYRSTAESDFGIKLPPERHLFFGRPDLSKVGPDDEEGLDLPTIQIDSTPEKNSVFKINLDFHPERGLVDLRVQAGGPGISSRVLGEKTLSIFLSARDIRAEAEQYWDRIALTEDETRVIQALKIIEGDIEDIGYSAMRSSDGETTRYGRFPIAKLESISRPEPLGNLGEGMNRTFALTIGLIRARGGVLLVDEIENGLHYSIQPDLWRMIFETAQELNVQVFATTHSHDCVRAFQQVSKEHEEEGMLISLRRKRSDSENIVAVPIEEDELEYAVESHTDVR